MSPLLVVITSEQARRLGALRESSEFSTDKQIGAMIDLELEEWQDTMAPDGASRSTRFARFEASDRGAK